jgi:hypothetical protein
MFFSSLYLNSQSEPAMTSAGGFKEMGMKVQCMSSAGREINKKREACLKNALSKAAWEVRVCRGI